MIVDDQHPRQDAVHRPARSGRPTRLAGGVAAVVVVGLLASACSSPDSARVGGTGSTSTRPTTDRATVPSATASATSGSALSGAPAALTAVIAKRYGGMVPPEASATTGTWFGAPVAVVTAGDDVTLAVGPTWRVVGGWWPSLGQKTPELGPAGPRFVLAIGSDARKGQSLERSRADVLQVIGTDGKGGGGVMGMARDLWVPLSTGGKGKINSAMVFGGPKAQLATVKKVTGLPLEGYVVMGFSGFTKVVNEQGGIPIVVPQTVDASHAGIIIKQGQQTLSGKDALAYARERKTLPDGDFGRSRHQGELVLAAAVKAKLAGPQAIPAAFTSFSTVGKTNLSAEQMLTYAAGLYRLSPLQVGRGVAQGGFGTASGQSIVVLGAEAKKLFASFRDGNLS
ncbi:MAG: LCP family protein [Terracoccus sp.]